MAGFVVSAIARTAPGRRCAGVKRQPRDPRTAVWHAPGTRVGKNRSSADRAAHRMELASTDASGAEDEAGSGSGVLDPGWQAVAPRQSYRERRVRRTTA